VSGIEANLILPPFIERKQRRESIGSIRYKLAQHAKGFFSTCTEGAHPLLWCQVGAISARNVAAGSPRSTYAVHHLGVASVMVGVACDSGEGRQAAVPASELASTATHKRRTDIAGASLGKGNDL
jgi:hypothetical protein